jgi:hypothetical protein
MESAAPADGGDVSDAIAGRDFMFPDVIDRVEDENLTKKCVRATNACQTWFRASPGFAKCLAVSASGGSSPFPGSPRRRGKFALD